ncbi:SapC family protein [Ramlibacter rhizophilus]|uniref:SapC family protein n=1 Tax=Ramlibacter rhizophilus TaxID=1781167 RepID=A0A4Z0BR98_9BURK|nr:SapC family protein [Ramlibacter rhizophilus]TFZ01351.1 SapC family protein [Ramlibacter rhizophilus]
MAAPTFYVKPALIDRERHRALRVRRDAGFGFAAGAHAMPLAAAEFKEACKEYAIVFARGAQGVEPQVLLGLRDGENLFVDAAGHWDARYLPAFVRRHPFVLAELPNRSLGVCVDEAFAAPGGTEGDSLFDAEGRETPFLRQSIDFLERFQHEWERTRAFCQRLDQAGVLQAMNARAEPAGGGTFDLQGLWVVDEQRLRALDDPTVLAFFRAGELELIGMHLLSLSNLQGLLVRLDECKRAGATTPSPSGGG